MVRYIRLVCLACLQEHAEVTTVEGTTRSSPEAGKETVRQGQQEEVAAAGQEAAATQARSQGPPPQQQQPEAGLPEAEVQAGTRPVPAAAAAASSAASAPPESAWEAARKRGAGGRQGSRPVLVIGASGQCRCQAGM